MKNIFKKSIMIILTSLMIFAGLGIEARANTTKFQTYTYAFIKDKDLAILSDFAYDSKLPLRDKKAYNKFFDKNKKPYLQKLGLSSSEIEMFKNDYIPILSIYRTVKYQDGGVSWEAEKGFFMYVFYSRSSRSFIYSFRGTKPSDSADTGSDMSLVLNTIPLQYFDGVEAINIFNKKLKSGTDKESKSLQSFLKSVGYSDDGSYSKPRHMFTGHSLGGFLAMMVAMKYMDENKTLLRDNIYATTFNAPGASGIQTYNSLTKSILKKDPYLQNNYKHFFSVALLPKEKKLYMDKISTSSVGGVISGRMGSQNSMFVDIPTRRVMSGDKLKSFMTTQWTMVGTKDASKKLGILKYHSINTMIQGMKNLEY